MSGVLAFPKPVRSEDEAYLRFIRRQPCLIDHAAAEAHHTRAGGMGTKCSDYRTLPLCPRHHRECHQLGHLLFEAAHNVDFQAELIRFLEMYLSALRDGQDLGEKDI